MKPHLVLVLLVLLGMAAAAHTAACSSDDPSELRGNAPPVDTDGSLPNGMGHPALRRLTSQELRNSLVDLLHVPASALASLDDDIPGPSGFSNDSSALTVGSLRMAQLLSVVESALDSAFAAPASPLLQCPNNVRDAACARAKLQDLASRAYHHVVAPAEVDDLLLVYTDNQSAGFQAALSTAMSRVLLAPSFMYLTSFSGTAGPNGVGMSDSEYAARLSYLLWSSVPDQPLLDLAAQGTLRTPDVLRAEIKRMLADSRADRFVADFFGQWLGFTQILDADQVIRAGITPQLRSQFYDETRLFVRSILDEDKSLMTLVTANYSFLNKDLAAHYGVAGVTGTQFQRVPLAGAHRAGVLSHGSVLSVLSNPADSRPVARGHFLLAQFVCAPPPPPPDNIDTSAVSGDAGDQTIRQRLERHRAAGSSCASCHSTMDPLGLSEENFDQIGRYRAQYSTGQPIDATGTLKGENFSDFLGMSALLAKQPPVRPCLAQKVLTYAANRTLAPEEVNVPAELAATAVQDTSTFSDLLFQVVTSASFNFNSTESH